MANSRKPTGKLTVTNENIGHLLLKSMREAVAIEQARAKPAKVRTVRQGKVAAPPVYPAARVRLVRDKLGVSQAVFAKALNVSLNTVRSWEQGARMPNGPSRRLLQVAERPPHAVVENVR